MEFGFDDGPLRLATTVTNARANARVNHRANPRANPRANQQCSAAPTGFLAPSGWTGAR
jgi:hypothetical protein